MSQSAPLPLAEGDNSDILPPIEQVARIWERFGQRGLFPHLDVDKR